MTRAQAPLDAPREAFWHQKWPCVLGIGANDEDRGRLLVLKWRLGGSVLEASWSQMPRRDAQRRVDIGGSFVQKKHQKSPCVLDIGANVEDRGRLLWLVGGAFGVRFGAATLGICR